MIRLLIFAFLIYMLYRLFKGVLISGQNASRSDSSSTSISEMVQDPECKTYIPREEAVRAVIGGRELFFCSRECADKFKNKTES